MSSMVCLQMSTLCLSALLLEHHQRGCLPDIAPCVSRNFVPREIFPISLPADHTRKFLGPQGMNIPIHPSSWQCTDTILVCSAFHKNIPTHDKRDIYQRQVLQKSFFEDIFISGNDSSGHCIALVLHLYCIVLNSIAQLCKWQKS